MTNNKKPIYLALFLTLFYITSWHDSSCANSLDIKSVMDQAVASHAFPGACIVLGNDKKILYQRCVGYHTYQKKIPDKKTDLFDLASLTKVVATTPAIMRLVEMKKINLDDKVSNYLPEFLGSEKSEITIKQLLNHRSGLPSENYTDSWEKLLSTPVVAPPGSKENYSDLNFVILGKIIECVTHKPLNAAVNDLVFKPMGMVSTSYKPTCKNIVPTSSERELGIVHDPQAKLLSCVAGNAGVFSNISDLHKLAQTLLNKGRYQNQQIFQPSTIQLFTTRMNEDSTRALGWDTVINPNNPILQHQFSAGLMIDANAFGHSGFTGTAMWISQKQNLYMILLTNRVYEQGGNHQIDRYWRQKIATTAWQRFGYKNHNGLFVEHQMLHIEQGVDRLNEPKFAQLLKNKQIAIVANKASVDYYGKNIVDIFKKMDNIRVTKIFTPEHGFSVEQDDKIQDSKDKSIPVLSLYGPRKAPSKEELADVDVIVFDIQDVGLRYYTYISTLAYMMKAAKENHKKIIVLDRINPLGGSVVSGPMLDVKYAGYFTSYYPLPMRYGLTIGELARYYNRFHNIDADLSVVPLKNWHRSVLFSDTDSNWLAPSPALPTFNQVILYNTFGVLETLPLSVGRSKNNTHAFERFGAPWINQQDAEVLVAQLNDLKLPGMQFSPVHWTPDRSIFNDQVCNGFAIRITDVRSIEPYPALLKVLKVLHTKFAEKIHFQAIDSMLGATWVREAIEQGVNCDEIVYKSTKTTHEFLEQCREIMLY